MAKKIYKQPGLTLLLPVLLIMFFWGCTRGSRREVSDNQSRFRYVLSMVFDNPGEAPTSTKYKDPVFLKHSGFTGMVAPWHIQCALTYDSFEEGIIPEGSKEREWILKKQETVKARLNAAEKAGLPVYAFTDVFVLPTLILEKYKSRLVKNPAATDYQAIKGRLAPDIARPLTEKLLRIQIDELFSTFPQLDGLVIRFGETYLFDTPYHAGGNPVQGDENAKINVHIKLIRILKEEVCEKRNKKLFYRTWDFGFFHTNPEVFLRITDQITPHENLIFSIKYTKGDFHRLTPFNPTIGIGKHQYIVEYQCQPEYYGKGAHPVWVFGGLLNGFEEYDQIMTPGEKQGLKDLAGDPHFAGLWLWPRGGGWRGPYISNELWCDMNVMPALEWCYDTTLTETEALKAAALKAGIQKNSLDDFVRLVRLSADGIVRGHCSLIDIPQSHFNVWWMRDHFIEGSRKLKPFFDYLIAAGKTEEALEEKANAVLIWKNMRQLAGTIETDDPRTKEYIVTSTTYGRIKYEVIENAFIVMLLGYRGDVTGEYDKKRIASAIQRYDELWNEWKQLKRNHSSCPTLYYPLAFHIDENGVSGTEINSLEKEIDKYRDLK